MFAQHICQTVQRFRHTQSSKPRSSRDILPPSPVGASPYLGGEENPICIVIQIIEKGQ